MKYTLTANDVASQLNVTTQTVRAWVKQGAIEFQRVGSRYRFSQETINNIQAPHNAKQTESILD